MSKIGFAKVFDPSLRILVTGAGGFIGCPPAYGSLIPTARIADASWCSEPRGGWRG
jgi:hypothetical protein